MHQDSRARPLLRPPRVPLVAVLLACIAACDAQPSTGPAPRGAATLLSPVLEPGAPLPGLTLEQRALFERGRGLFQTEFTPETGLGPLFNNNACSQCHEDPVTGGIGEEVERHATAFRAPACDDLAPHGGPVIQDSVTPALHAALGIEREAVPAEATDSAARTTPSLLGFGLLDALPDAEILALADLRVRHGVQQPESEQARRGPRGAVRGLRGYGLALDPEGGVERGRDAVLDHRPAVRGEVVARGGPERGRMSLDLFADAAGDRILVAL